jgi:hypothetical protein
MCLDFLFNLRQTFITTRRIQQDIVINEHRLGFMSCTGYSHQILMKLDISREIFEKILKYQISNKSVLWEESFSMRTDRQTNRHDQAFRNFSNEPKMTTCIRTYTYRYIYTSIHTYVHTHTHTHTHSPSLQQHHSLI